MVAFGVDPAEAAARVASLSDARFARSPARSIGCRPARACSSRWSVPPSSIFLVLLITDLLGLTHVFPFVNHPSR